jgi:hypothetical protein
VSGGVYGTPSPTVINNNNSGGSSYNSGGSSYNGSGGIYQTPNYTYPVYTQPTYNYQPAPVYQQPIYQPTYQQTYPVYTQPTYPQQNYYVQPQPIVAYNDYPNNEVACYASITSATIGQSVSWSAGGSQLGFRYSWVGTDGLSGNQSIISTTYATPGTKSATVIVTYPNGQSVSKVCGTTVTVRSTAVVSTPAPIQYVQVPAPTTDQTNNANLTGASLFAVSGLTLGLLGLFVILILLIVIFYLIFSNTKKE